jgi:MFS family permease
MMSFIGGPGRYRAVAMTRRNRLRQEGPALALLALMLAVGLFLRLHNNDYGLPYVYYADEGSHFTNRAVEMLAGDQNPGYFQNPSAFTYVVEFALRVYFGHGWIFGNFRDVIDKYGDDPTRIYQIGRTVAALLCIVGVAGVYAVGRALFNRRTGLVAAAVLCFSFLAIAYSRIAVTDTGTLLPVVLALFFAIRLQERQTWRWAAAAGVATGVAIGFKYTAGLVLLAPLIALAWPPSRARLVPLAALLGTTLIAFFVTTPYFFLDFSTAERQLRAQADLAGGIAKYGQEYDNGWIYYGNSLTWGLGWLALIAAVAGFVLLWRRQRARAVLLAIFPVVLFAYLATQQRYFGRWLLPCYPALALLAGYAMIQAVAAIRRMPARLVPAALAVVTIIVAWQGFAAGVRSMAVLGHSDTRDAARAWLVDNERTSLRVIVEPAVPARWYWRLRSNGTRVPHRKQFVRAFSRDVKETHVEYGRTLSPATIDAYRRNGFCLVMTVSLIAGRSTEARDPRANAYYDRLRAESTRVFHVSPLRVGAEAQPFNFDLSYNYYSPAFQRPGPTIDIYRLDNCVQQYGTTEAGAGTPSLQ